MNGNEFGKIIRSFIDDFDAEEDLIEIRSDEETTDYLFRNFDDLLLTELYTKYKIPLAVVQDICEGRESEYKIVRGDLDLENFSYISQLMDSIKFPKNTYYRLYVGFVVTIDNE